jgi:hypothetical protein
MTLPPLQHLLFMAMLLLEHGIFNTPGTLFPLAGVVLIWVVAP